MAIKETHVTLPRRELKDPDGIYERYCPQCGKTFVCWKPSDWCYRIGHRIFCSWTCYRERERGVRPHPGKKAAEAILESAEVHRKRQHTNRPAALAQTREIIRLKEKGMSNQEIAEELGVSKSVVAQRLTKYGRELGWQPMGKREAGMIGVERQKEKRRKRESRPEE